MGQRRRCALEEDEEKCLEEEVVSYGRGGGALWRRSRWCAIEEVVHYRGGGGGAL